MFIANVEFRLWFLSFSSFFIIVVVVVVVVAIAVIFDFHSFGYGDCISQAEKYPGACLGDDVWQQIYFDTSSIYRIYEWICVLVVFFCCTSVNYTDLTQHIFAQCNVASQCLTRNQLILVSMCVYRHTAFIKNHHAFKIIIIIAFQRCDFFYWWNLFTPRWLKSICRMFAAAYVAVIVVPSIAFSISLWFFPTIKNSLLHDDDMRCVQHCGWPHLNIIWFIYF